MYEYSKRSLDDQEMNVFWTYFRRYHPWHYKKLTKKFNLNRKQYASKWQVNQEQLMLQAFAMHPAGYEDAMELVDMWSAFEDGQTSSDSE